MENRDEFVKTITRDIQTESIARCIYINAAHSQKHQRKKRERKNGAS